MKARFMRHKKVRAKIKGSAKKPRLCVFRSNKHIYAQLFDDEKGVVIASSCDKDVKAKKKGKVAAAFETGKILTTKALEKKIKNIVFDRGGYKYHGRVKAVADGAREGGLKF